MLEDWLANMVANTELKPVIVSSDACAKEPATAAFEDEGGCAAHVASVENCMLPRPTISPV